MRHSLPKFSTQNIESASLRYVSVSHHSQYFIFNNKFLLSCSFWQQSSLLNDNNKQHCKNCRLLPLKKVAINILKVNKLTLMIISKSRRHIQYTGIFHFVFPKLIKCELNGTVICDSIISFPCCLAHGMREDSGNCSLEACDS